MKTVDINEMICLIWWMQEEGIQIQYVFLVNRLIRYIIYIYKMDDWSKEDLFMRQPSFD
jgi:hypothetical protein